MNRFQPARSALPTRREFIGASLGASALLAAGVPLRTRAAAGPSQSSIVPVRIDPGRVIRTMVGLRPFRAAGFVLRAQSFGDKVLVHNYGHGGGGFSLSWGCATLAADLVADRSPSRAAVLGCGVIGLTTARILQERGWQVTIYAADLPPQTTSNIAGAQWTPTSVFLRDRTTPAFMETFRQASRIANRRFQLMVGSTYGVRWIDNYMLKHDAQPGELDSAASAGIADLYADVERVDPASVPFVGFSDIRRFTTMLMEPNTFLPAVQRDFLLQGGHIVVHDFHAPSEIARLPERIVFNCTGLGSRTLFGDTMLEPVRGQLTILEPQADVDYIYLVNAPLLYMFPRDDGIVLGGTFERDNWSTMVDLATQNRILGEHEAVFAKG